MGVPETGQNDMFVMGRAVTAQLREAGQVGNADQGDSRQPSRQDAAAMGRTNDPAVKADAKRRDLYVPILAFIDTGNYLTYTRGGQNLVFAGAQDKAVRVEIVYSSH